MKLTIIGASGHGKVVADIAEKNGYDQIVFYDDDPKKTACGKWPVAGPTSLALAGSGDVFVAIGDAKTRERYMDLLAGRRLPVLVHPAAVTAPDAVIGEGSVLMAGAVVNPGAVLGRGVIINTCASVDHDCRLGDFVHLSVGAHLSGTVTLGKGTWVAIGACVINNVTVCGGCTIGAGAAVVRDIPEPGTYVGVPARLRK